MKSSGSPPCKNFSYSPVRDQKMPIVSFIFTSSAATHRCGVAFGLRSRVRIAQRKTRCAPSYCVSAVLAERHQQSAPMHLPETYRRLVGRHVGQSFREVCEEETVDISPPGEGKVLVKVIWAGINGGCETFRVRGETYTAFARNASAEKFALGAECAGVIAAVGPGVSLKVGQAVTASGGLLDGGGFAEYLTAAAAQCFPVPAATPEAVALTLSGVTAAVALEVTGGPLREGETAFITAAAGGTGHFGTQLALLAGCRVVATAGGEAKAQRLRALGVHRVIDYKREDVRGVLDAEFPGKLDVVYEGVGGNLFRAALANLSPGGRLLSVGYISEYPHVASGSEDGGAAPPPVEVEGWQLPSMRDLFWKQQKLQRNGQTVYGNVWAGADKEKVAAARKRVFDLHAEGKLQAWVDPKQFTGLSAVPDAIEYMLSGQSIGKVVVRVQEP